MVVNWLKNWFMQIVFLQTKKNGFTKSLRSDFEDKNHRSNLLIPDNQAQFIILHEETLDVSENVLVLNILLT